MIKLQLYSTLARRKLFFTPLDTHNVRMYVCGPTVYDRAHIGNMRPVIVFDVLYRLLKHLYPKVTYVSNITDVDDKIIQAAAIKQCSIEEITTEATRWYQEDCAALGALLPTVTPRATEHIPQMIQMIECLIDVGCAYASENHVLFDVSKYKDYGQLSNRKLEDMISGARVEVAGYKKSPGDFVLWKPSGPDVPGWDSPWGRGRPGWHIECSAMARQYLGETFDIHGGGIDLLFPHHENERAQSCCAGKTTFFAKYWIHNGHVTIDGKKMSKSDGNFFTVADKRQSYSGAVMRYVMLSTHYRQPLDWRDDLADQAKKALDRLYMALRDVDHDLWCIDFSPSDRVLVALADDLNTPQALQICHDLAGDINKSYGAHKRDLQQKLLGAGRLLGLFQSSANQWFQCGDMKLSSQDIEDLIEKRHAAKKAKDYSAADAVRLDLEEKGVILEDSREGTTWRFK